MYVKILRILAMFVAATLTAGFAAACDDDDGDETPTPTPAVALTQAPEPTLTPLPTTAPGITPEPPARIQLFASPQQLYCDGGTPSMVTARVFDANDVPVEDGTEVRFEVVTLATANPINALTRRGSAESTIVALGSGEGVVVTVSSGEAAASIRIDCL
jgi:hypothetical protein